jgi:hypothetical protein
MRWWRPLTDHRRIKPYLPVAIPKEFFRFPIFKYIYYIYFARAVCIEYRGNPGTRVYNYTIDGVCFLPSFLLTKLRSVDRVHDRVDINQQQIIEIENNLQNLRN